MEFILCFMYSNKWGPPKLIRELTILYLTYYCTQYIMAVGITADADKLLVRANKSNSHNLAISLRYLFVKSFLCISLQNSNYTPQKENNKRLWRFDSIKKLVVQVYYLCPLTKKEQRKENSNVD